MALQFSTAVRDALLDVIESTVGTSAVLRMFDGVMPANCAAADAGTKCVEMSLQSDWMAASSSGSKAKSGTWSDASADATGTVDYFRLYASNGTTCHMQGTITATGGGGDMTVDNINVAALQVVTITGFTLTAPGA